MTDDTTDGRTLGERIPVKRILSVVGLLLLILLVLPFVIYAAPQVVGAEHSYVVLSGSMEPAISPGDVIVVDQTSLAEIQEGDIKEGDIITFLREGEDRPTTHRVVGVVEQDGNIAFETKGDNNDAADQGLVTPSQIQGKIPTVAGFLFVIPYVGYVIRFAGTTLGFALLVVIPITLLLTSEVYTMLKSATIGDAGSDDENNAGESVETTTLWSNADSTGATVDGQPAASGDGPVTHVDSAALSGQSGTDDRSTTRTIVIEKTAAPDTDDSGPVTFTAPELELGIVVLAGFLAYSGWIAYSTLTTWSFAVAGSVGAAFLLLSLLYLSGRRSGGSTSESAEETTTETEVVLESSALHEQLAHGRTTADALRAEIGLGVTERLDASGSPDTESSGLTADGSGQIESRSERGANDD